MAGKSVQLFATDKEIYDLLISSRQKLSERALLGLARDRRIFLSSKATREQLTDYMSLLPHDLRDVEGLLDETEIGKRGERSTFVEISGDVSIEDVKAALLEYKSDVAGSENVTIPPFNANRISATVEYSEFDYSRTRLLQRQERKAGIEFRVQDGKVIARLPATDKGHILISEIIDKIERNKKTEFVKDRITVAKLTPELKTSFFLDLMASVDGYSTETVTSVKVSSPEEFEVEDDDPEEEPHLSGIETELLGIVRSVALNGENLVFSPQYTQLSEKRFFITSVTWRALQKDSPHDLVQFEAAFDNAAEGTGFRYMVRYAQRNSFGRYSKSMKIVPEPRRQGLFQVVEQAARVSLSKQLKRLEDEDRESPPVV